MAYGHKTPQRARQRASIVLLAARGRGNVRIAAETHLHVDTVRTWRGRFAHGGLPVLSDRKRSGRPARFTPVQVAEAKALACQLPAETGVPLSCWSCPELAAELTACGITNAVSAVRRWLREDALKPGSTDPGSSSATRTSAPGPSASWTCTPARSKVLLAYLAAYDVHQATVFGRCEPTTGIVPFMNLVTQGMAQEPYASAKRVFWVVDNGSSHRGERAINRLTTTFPNAVMVATPVHASWTNQIEPFFSIVQRKVVNPNDFSDLGQVRDRPRAFEDRYNATAQPFQWKFTTTDLDDLLARVDRHTPADRHEDPPQR